MTKFQQLSDKAAIGLSMLCVVHCLLFPVLLIVIPPLTGLFAMNDEVFHQWLLGAVIPISVIALLMGYWHHRHWQVFMLGFIGLTILLFAAFWGHDLLGKFGEVGTTVVGSSIIAYGHVRNYTLRRQQKCADAHQQEKPHL